MTVPEKKRRIPIAPAVRESVLREFNHRCAICGADRPQIHHIDEDPSNNTLDNLLPICPNCHLTDYHNPTVPTSPEKLALFRKYKDPVILSPQFEPLFSRFRFLAHIAETERIDDLARRAQELVDFVFHLQMGQFYCKRIAELTAMPSRSGISVGGLPDPREQEEKRQFAIEYRKQLSFARPEIYSLIMELLRYQNWLPNSAPSPSLAADGWRRS